MRRRLIAAAAGVLLVITGAVVTARFAARGPSPQLLALQSDPIGQYEPSGGRLVRVEAENESLGGFMTKPRTAEYGRLFTLPSDGAEDEFERAIEASRAAGWSFPDDPFSSLGAVVRSGTKQLPSGEARVAIMLFRDATLLPDDVRPPALQIDLQHTSATPVTSRARNGSS